MTKTTFALIVLFIVQMVSGNRKSPHKRNAHLVHQRIHRSPIFEHKSPNSNQIIACPEKNSRLKILEIVFLSSERRTFSDSPQHKCQSKSLPGDEKLCSAVIGRCVMPSGQPPAQMICGHWSDRFYVLFECVPVPLRQIARWQRLSSKSSPSDLTTLQLLCPKSMSIVIESAIAAISDPVQQDMRCPMQEAYTKQVGRACQCSYSAPPCNKCAAPVLATNYRCKGRPIANDLAIIDYLCLPDFDAYPSMPRIDICQTGSVETESLSEAFITSPNYPNRYGSQLNCTMTIVVVKNKNLNLFLLDFDVLYGHSLTITSANNNQQPVQLYATDSISRALIQNGSTHVTIAFASNLISAGRGFKLYFTVDTPLNLSEPSKQQQQPTPKPEIRSNRHRSLRTGFSNKRSNETAQTSRTMFDLDHEQQQELALIVGISTVACAFALLLIIIGLIIYCLRPFRFKKKPTNHKIPKPDHRMNIPGSLLLNMSIDEDDLTSNEYERVKYSAGNDDDEDFPTTSRSPEWTTCTQSLYRCNSCGRHLIKLPNYASNRPNLSMVSSQKQFSHL